MLSIKQYLRGIFFLALVMTSSAVIPNGRIAFVNDASASRDADDVAAIPFQVAMLSAFNATDRLVHWSYHCDYTGPVYAPDREAALETSLFGALNLWGDPRYGAFDTGMVFNCRNETQRNAGIAHLAARINESSATDPLWIIEAGEPDVIGYALQAAAQISRTYIKVVTHHPHNDVGAFWNLASTTGGKQNISALPGMASDFIVRIPDQNINLKKPVSNFGWMTSSTDPRIAFLSERYLASTIWDGNPAPGTVDISDAGMLWYLLDGGPDGDGLTNVTPAQVGTKLTAWAAAHPAATIDPPPVSDDYHVEANGLVVMDAEFVAPAAGWAADTRIPGYTGSSYYVATGFDSFTTPGRSTMTYKFAVTKSGLYQLQWRSAITDKNGNFYDLHSEHNDSWSQMLNASGAVIAPANAATLDGGRTDSSGLRWFKTYNNIKNTWGWQAVNKDGGGNAIYWNLQPGQVYQFRVSLRSQGHAIDKIILWDRSLPTPYGPEGGKPTNEQNNLCNAAPISQIIHSNPTTPIIYNALVDFPSIAEGLVPYYKDNARGALAINAGVVANRDQFARASLTFSASAGTYNITLTALKETDGECPYRLLVNGVVVGTATNSPTAVDYEEQNHVFNGIAIPAGATISVESKAVTNGEIPEGSGTAYARGRWTKLSLTAATSSANDPVVSFNTPPGNITVDIETDLYVRVNATSNIGITSVAIYKDNILVRTVSSAPYEWGLAGQSNDLSLRNLQAGSFVLKAIATDTSNNSCETSIVVTVQPRVAAYFTYTGGTGNWETSGGWSSGISWNGPFTGTTLLPSSIDDFTLGIANVTLNSAVTVDDYRIGDSGASPSGAGNLTLATGSALNAKVGSIGYNRAATMSISVGAQLNHTGDLVVGYRGMTTVEVKGSLITRDLKLQFISANPRAAASVINVHPGGVLTINRNLQIGGDDGTANYTGLNGRLNILSGGIVQAMGWDLRMGANIFISEGGQLRINGDQVNVVNAHITSGFITSSAPLSIAYSSGATLISVNVVDGYEAWATSGGIGPATSDDDNDGWTNLLEYAIGGNPFEGGDTKPTMVRADDTIRFSCKQRNDDDRLIYVLQGNTNLISPAWTDLAAVKTIDSTDGNYDNVTLTVTESASPYFVRLKVTRENQ